MPKSKVKMMDPIPEEELEEWNDLVQRSRAIVASVDKGHIQLVLIAAEVETKYGESRLQRWAEDIGISYRQARKYKALARKKLDKDFIHKWLNTPEKREALSFSIIQEIAGHCGGSLQTEYAEEYLQWAIDHRATVSSIRGYMMEIITPDRHFEDTAAEIKFEMGIKQDFEGFSDSIRHDLEKLVEEHPELRPAIENNVIQTREDYEELLVRAGEKITHDEEAERFANHTITKLKRWRNEVRTLKAEAKLHIATGQIMSDELVLHAKNLREELDDLINTKPIFDALEENSDEVNLQTGEES